MHCTEIRFKVSVKNLSDLSIYEHTSALPVTSKSGGHILEESAETFWPISLAWIAGRGTNCWPDFLSLPIIVWSTWLIKAENLKACAWIPKRAKFLVSFSSLVKPSPSKKMRGVTTGQRKPNTAGAEQTQHGQLSVTVAQTNAEQSQPDEESTALHGDSAVSPTSETPGSEGKVVEGWHEFLPSCK